MPCAFSLDPPSAFEGLKLTGRIRAACQFREEKEFFKCDDKHWCRFHLPMNDRKNQPTEDIAFFEMAYY